MSELEIAKTAAIEAGKVLLSFFSAGKTGIISAKGPVDKVTEADKKSELLIRKITRKNFPNHGFFGEEFGEVKGKDNYKWYVDPLCGTFNFIHNLPEFGISIGLTYNEKWC